jgi:putative ABC transport system substrate-binding protein
MERRTFLGTLAGGFLTAPLAAQAQTPARVPRIGVLAVVPRSAPGIRAFDDRLQDLGYVDGRTIAVEFRAAAEHLERLPGLAAELVRLDIALLVAAGAEPAARAARQAAGSSLPIIMVAIDYDPIALGYVTSLARPAGNITGVVGQQIELTRKRVELLKEALPRASRVAILWEAASEDQFKAAQAAARSLSLNVQSLQLHSPSYELSDAFRRAVAGRADAILVTTTPFLFQNRAAVAELARKNRLPTMSAVREVADAGGLVAYGASVTGMYAQAAVYVDKILKGSKPGDLPVEQPTKFELVINLKTAKALGLTLPPSLLQRADQVIE